MLKSAVTYLRVSTTEQKDLGHSLPEQSRRVNSYCEEVGIKILKEFEDDHSAKNFVRPKFTELMTFLTKNKGKVDYVLVHKWDRFSRNIGEAYRFIELIKTLGAEVNAVDEWIDFDVPQQHFMLGIYLSLGDVENRVKSDRTKMGIHSALLSGRYINMQPKGYMKGQDELGKPLMKPDPQTSSLV